MELNFSTGKLDDVARRGRVDRRREFRWFWLILALACIPYGLLFWWRPGMAAWFVFAAAGGKVVQAFLASSHTNTSHHIRFLLAGSNPIGMTGSLSLLLGAVDALFDWKEDRAIRRRGLVHYWLTSLAKFLATPLGLVLIVAEFLWDACLLKHGFRRGIELGKLKLQEFFSVAYFHDLVCPEKSNDIFYADLAVARLNDDPHLYQWQRLRAMVFELEHYRLDLERVDGHANTNIFLQDEFTAYQTLRRLQFESLEQAVGAHFAEPNNRFPLPRELSSKLIRNARPIEHYIRIRSEQPVATESSCLRDREFYDLLYGASDSTNNYYTWHVLRMMETGFASSADCRYLTEAKVSAMTHAGLTEAVEQKTDDSDSDTFHVKFTPRFLSKLDSFVKRHFEAIDEDALRCHLIQPQPRLLLYRESWYRFLADTHANSME